MCVPSGIETALPGYVVTVPPSIWYLFVATPEVASDRFSVNVGVDTYQLFEPSGDAGLIVIVVLGLTLSSLMWVVFVVSVFPARSTDQ